MSDEAGKPNGTQGHAPGNSVQVLFQIVRLPNGQIGFQGELPPEQLLGTIVTVLEDVRFMAMKARLASESRIVQVPGPIAGLKSAG